MNILVTGDLGYVGSVLVPMLVERGCEVVGLDVGYFADCLLCEVTGKYRRYSKDLRDVSADDLQGIDAIIHLAGLSNDPAGELHLS